MSAPKILLTGRPGVGKTHVIRRTLSLLARVRATGFYTRELRGSSGRLGFEAVTLDGMRRTLAHVDYRGQHRVGKYGVDVEGFEREIVPSIEPAAVATADLMVIDEIGKMECFSTAFCESARRALEGSTPVLGTVASRGGGFIAEARAMPHVLLVEVTRTNRDGLPPQLARQLGSDIRVEQGAIP